MKHRAVRIIRPPIGEAPLWVREAWVGLVLPLLASGHLTVETAGVVTGPKSAPGRWWAWVRGRTQPVTGYVVSSSRAIGLLEAQKPEAARWWRENAPLFLKPGEAFIFDLPACELVDTLETDDGASRPWDRQTDPEAGPGVMQSPALKFAGYGLMGLVVGGAFLAAVVAALKGEPYLWRNYWNASVTTWGAIVTFGAVIAVGVIWVIQRLWRRLKGPGD